MVVRISEAGFQRALTALASSAAANSDADAERYLQLGSRVLRVIVRAAEVLPQIDTQLNWSIVSPRHYDATLVIYREPNPERYVRSIKVRNRQLLMRSRVEELCRKVACCDLTIRRVSGGVIDIRPDDGIIEAVDPDAGTYYYGVRDSRPEELIRQGHLLVQIINRFVQTENANLAHGACVGIGGKGVLLCGIGHRGKSTLTVMSLLHGFDYVSDDYQILERDGGGLYAYPIYSIITLSKEMRNEMGPSFDGEYISPNARRDKDVYSISAYHKQFKNRLPIKACVFPEIVADPDPDIVPCSGLERSRAIAQLVGSTAKQMHDLHHPAVMKKLADMIKDFPFYKIKLSRNLPRNVECLKEFCRNA